MDARPLQEAAGRFAQDRLTGLVERGFDGVYEPGFVVRLDRVEIQLGELPVDEFESALSEACERCLAAQLAKALKGGPGPQGSRRLAPEAVRRELLEEFVRTGTVPWWADTSNPTLIPDALRAWIAADPRECVDWIRSQAISGRGWRRLLPSYSDADFSALIDAAAPNLGNRLLALAHDLRNSSALGGSSGLVSEQRMRCIVRAALLASVIRPHGGDPERQVLEEVGVELGISADAVERATGRTSAGPSPRGDTPAAWDGILEVLRERAVLSSPDSLVEALRRQLAQTPVPASVLGRWLARAPDSMKKDAELRVIEAVKRVLREPAKSSLNQGMDEAADGGSRNDTGENAVHVDNAGLVLLWPFFEQFFGHLGLVVDHAFRDEVARHRAVGLLQLLAAGDPAPPEFRVPLNKVLCGLPVDAVLEPDEPYSDAEFSECDALLAAVLQQVPMLGRLSPAGLQGSFLLRPGQLVAGEGAWLLRVRREMHDVVLERLPWTLGWVRLPWMPAPIQVEWL